MTFRRCSVNRAKRDSITLQDKKLAAKPTKGSQERCTHQVEAYPTSRSATTVSRNLGDELVPPLIAPDALRSSRPDCQVGEVGECNPEARFDVLLL